MIIALPSRHERVADALAAEGFDVIHIDRHIRAFLTELNPPISATPVMANMQGSGRLSDKLDERRKAAFRWQQAGARVDAADDHRVTVSQHRNGELESVDYDLFDDVGERNPELRRMAAALRRMLPAPDFTALEADTVIVGVDTDEQKASLPAEGVRYICLADRRPVWVSEVTDVTVIDAALARDEQGAAAVRAVRGLVPA